MESRILNDHYIFKHIESKAKSRLDCIQCTRSYDPFESLRNKAGELFIYLTDVPDKFKADALRKADKCISAKGKNISSLFVPDIVLPYGYGDVKNTTDAIIFKYLPDYAEIHIYISRGMRGNKRGLYCLLIDQQLNHEIDLLTSQLKSEQI